MRFYACFIIDSYGELIYDKSFVDRAKARKYFLNYIEENCHGNLQEIAQAVSLAEVEFDNYIARGIDAESDVMIVKVFKTED